MRIKSKNTNLNPQFDARVRFNWGYHDAASDFNQGRSERDLGKHFDHSYACGYKLGYRDAREGAYAESSDAAWSGCSTR